jgi:hypothetical protein
VVCGQNVNLGSPDSPHQITSGEVAIRRRIVISLIRDGCRGIPMRLRSTIYK